MYNFLLQAAEGNPKSGIWGTIILWTLVFVVIYFFMIRPSSKRQKEAQKFRDGLKKGDKVVTAGGIYGIVDEVLDKYIFVEISNNVKIKVDKNSVSGVADASTPEKKDK